MSAHPSHTNIIRQSDKPPKLQTPKRVRLDLCRCRQFPHLEPESRRNPAQRAVVFTQIYSSPCISIHISRPPAHNFLIPCSTLRNNIHFRPLFRRSSEHAGAPRQPVDGRAQRPLAYSETPRFVHIIYIWLALMRLALTCYSACITGLQLPGTEQQQQQQHTH